MSAERVGSVFWLLVGAAALHGGIDLGLGSTAEPGPGFLAGVAGAFVALMALIVFVQSLRSDPASRTRVSALWADVNGLRAVLVAGLTLAFILVFEYAGFVISSFVLLMVIMRFIEGLPWKTAVLIPAGAILATWLLFNQVLKLALPVGVFGI
jgi:putative tricarboxylic transport membrane protein